MRRCLAVLWTLLSLALTLGPAAAATHPWPSGLFQAGTSVWRYRVAVDLHNGGATATEGRAVSIVVGDGANQVPLVDALAQDVRVAAADGVEFLFDLRGGDGERLTEGRIPAGSHLIVPATAEPGATQRVYVYWDHPGSYPLPDFLAGATDPVNLSFENAVDNVPTGWNVDVSNNVDDAHAIGRVTDEAHTGRASIRCDVAPGAQPNWIGARQDHISLVPGVRYVVSGWVKGENVTGDGAGWYIHVGAGGQNDFINQVHADGHGTFGWKRIDMPFTAPANVDSLEVGTVLHGPGRAWFDDLSLTALDKVEQPVTATVGARETRELAEIGLPDGPLTRSGKTWECYADAVVVNEGDDAPHSLVTTSLGQLGYLLTRGFNAKSLRVVDPRTGAFVPVLRSRDTLTFISDLPGHSRVRYRIVFSANPRLGEGPTLNYDQLINGPGNLVKNPSFEEETDGKPTFWPGNDKLADGAKQARVRGGQFGQWKLSTYVPPTAPVDWIGWPAEIDAAPSTFYFIGAFLHTQGTGESARVYTHNLNAKDEWTGNSGWASAAAPSSTKGWQLVGGLAQTAPDTARVELHLTMNCRGLLEHDGVVMRRAVSATLGAIQQAPSGRTPQSADLRVWTVDPVIKVMPDSPAAAAPDGIRLEAGRGERESVQLCLRSSAARSAVPINVNMPRQRGVDLSAKIEQVGFVPVLEPSGYFNAKTKPWIRLFPTGAGRTDGWTGWWPDYLTPVTNGAVDLKADATQPVWVTFSVPRDAPAGDYRGTITVGDKTLPLKFTVWPYTLPERPSCQIIYDGGFPGDRNAWLQFMADHRVSAGPIEPAPVFTLVDGKVSMNATAYDAAAHHVFDELHASAAWWPGEFYAFGWAYPPRDFLGCKFGTPEYKSALQQAIRLFSAHVKAKGWYDRLAYYISDEPHYDNPKINDQMIELVKIVREADPELKVYSSTWTHNPNWDGYLNHWGIGQYGCFPMAEAAARAKAGDKLWFTTDGQMEIDTPYCACERLLPWYCFAYDVSGYEFWGMAWYTYNPFKYGWHSYIQQADEPGADKVYSVRYPNGDGYLAYPGERIGLKGPVSSVRLEQARDGEEDYELFRQLTALATQKPAYAAKVAALKARVKAMLPIPNAGGYRSSDILPDPSAVARVRHDAGALLVAATGK